MTLRVIPVLLLVALLTAAPVTALTWQTKTVSTGTEDVRKTGVASASQDIHVVCWVQSNLAGNGLIKVAWTTDGGITWTNLTLLSAATADLESCDVGVIDDDSWVVAYTDRAQTAAVRFRETHNSGVTWEAAVNGGPDETISDELDLDLFIEDENKWAVTMVSTLNLNWVYTIDGGTTYTNTVVNSLETVCVQTCEILFDGDYYIGGRNLASTPDDWRGITAEDIADPTWSTMFNQNSSDTNLLYGCWGRWGAGQWLIVWSEGSPTDLRAVIVDSTGIIQQGPVNLLNDVGSGECWTDGEYVFYFDTVADQYVELELTDPLGTGNQAVITTDDNAGGSALNNVPFCQRLAADSYTCALPGTVLLAHTPFDDAPDGSFTLSDPRDVRVNYEALPSVYARTEGDDRLWRFNATLVQLNNREGCPGTTAADTTYGLALSVDSMPLTLCTAPDPVTSTSVARKSNLLVHQNTENFVIDDVVAIDSWTANVVALAGRVGEGGARLVVGDMGAGTAICVRDEGTTSGLDAVDVDHWDGENLTFADPGIGLWVVRSSDCGLVAKDTGTQARAVALNNLTLWSGGTYGLRRHSYASGIATQATQATIIPTANAIRVSKDAQYIVAWNVNTGSVWLADAVGAMTILRTIALSGVRACDMDVSNNRIYCVDADSIVYYNVYDVTSGFGGVGAPGSVHAPPVGNPFDDETTVPTTTPPTITDPFNVGDTADALGISDGQAAMFWGIIVIVTCAAVLYQFTRHWAGVGAGAFMGVLLSNALGLTPDWVIVFFVAAVITGVVVYRQRAAGA